MYILSGIGLSLLLNWKEIKRQFGVRFPNVWVDDSLEFYHKYSDKVRGEDIPSSLAADVYDKYGPEGVDAMVAAWESQENSSEQPSMNAIHAVMMAQAASRYQDEVKQEAEDLGLTKDPATVKMTQTLSEKLSGKFSVKAEEEAVVEAREAPSNAPEKIGFRDRKIIEYENRIRQYSAPDKVAS